MIILGINQVPGILAWMHDSAAAIVVDGKIVAAAEEERFNRIRHSRGKPTQAIEYCLREAGVSLAEVDVIAIANNPWAPFRMLRPNLWPMNFIRDVINLIIFEYYKRSLKKESGAKIVYVDHHLAHAASTYYCSGHDEANVLTIDGSGETESFAFFEGKKGTLHRVWDIPLGNIFAKKKWHSIGGVYSQLTAFLKLGTHGEGKTMGLASYGEPRFDFSKILNIKSHKNYTIDRRMISELYGEYERKDKNAPLTQEHKDLAASLQHALEESILNLAKEAYDYNGVRHFAFAGGVTLNCNTNSRVLLSEFCDSLFVQPAANDGGIALGAALYVAGDAGEVENTRMNNAYFGPSYSNEEIEGLLKEAKVAYRKSDNIAKDAAELVADGKIIGWFQGRMEIGPRALGNRSIIADPTKKGMNDRVNIEIKHREVWRPFAPSVAEEDASKYFEGVDKAHESPFMLHTFYVREEYRDALPAITHVDGSSRIQTVRKDQNERYYDLIKEVEKRTGYPVVMNTSFNDAGEPIVCTPKDALKCFYGTGFDALAIGDFLVIK